MVKEIIVDAGLLQTRAAVLEDGEPAEILIEGDHPKRLVGNIYRGIVRKVFPGMQAAFVDIGVDKDAFLYVSEAVSGKETGADSSDVSHTNADVYKPRIEQLVKPGQEITVQVIKEPVEGKQAKVTINQGAIDKDLQFAGYNLLVTSEIDMSDMDMYNIYHNLWRIEESFKIMKSDLDARPVFLQKEETIKGHFLICYLTVLLERIFQFKILENKYSTNEIFRFIKDFKVTKAETKYINTATSSRFINDLSEMLRLPLTNYFLSETQIRSILNHKF
jgi:hypothetical protein